jgi:hypothetical protein
LTASQAQWLAETVWAQHAFLTAYTLGVVAQKQQMRRIQTLTIAKISSGLLDELSRNDFWAALPNLTTLKLLVSPDWRNEYVPGDRFFPVNMPMEPITAATKFTSFLRKHIVKLDNLSILTIGYVGGGENAPGLFARNQHVLPAPITEFPRKWISYHDHEPNPATMLTFDHIRTLTFENCWFSPCMLVSFMARSQYTSLHTLVLDSVSMLAKHSTTNTEPLSTVFHGLRCEYRPEHYMYETLPESASWTDTLNKITPGTTLEEQKYAEDVRHIITDDTLNPPPPNKDFRGYV